MTITQRSSTATMVNQDIIDSIVDFRGLSGIWVHEKVLCRSFKSIEGLAPRQVLTRAMQSFNKGYFVEDKKRQPVTQGPFDSIDTIHMATHGKNEEFSMICSLESSAVSKARPRWFFYGNNPLTFPVKKQLYIARLVMRLPEWKGWYKKKPHPMRSNLGSIKSICNDNGIDEKTIRRILFYSNCYEGREGSRSSYFLSPSLLVSPTPVAPALSTMRSPQLSNPTTTTSTTSTTTTSMPDRFITSALKTLTIKQLAHVEEELHRDDTLNAQGKHRKRWAYRACDNVQKERKQRLQKAVFQPAEKQLLVDWLDDGARYSDGARLARQNTTIHSESLRSWFTDECFACIRHIIFAFNIPTSRFGSLANCFSVLLLGRPLDLDEFPDRRTLNRRLLRLSTFDEHRLATSFEKYITTKTEHGFTRYFYSITDDSKHFKVDRHAVMYSCRENDNVPPAFKVLTVSTSASKDSKSNAKLNCDTMKSSFTPNIIKHYGGNVSDNATDAKKESRVTFATLVGDRIENGVQPRPILLCNLFHADNLAVHHASVTAFGDTERNNHRQRHHRQLLQSIYDLHMIDQSLSQGLMDLLVGDSRINVKVMRERVQRWLVNQRNSSWVIEMMDEKVNGEPLLLA